jgi:hypothetical protein
VIIFSFGRHSRWQFVNPSNKPRVCRNSLQNGAFAKRVGYINLLEWNCRDKRQRSTYLNKETVMLKRTFTMSLLAGALTLCLGLALAVEPASAPAQEQVYGSQLMTQKERAVHRAKMRAAKTPEQMAQVRAEHHERMQERAKQQGVTLPDTPPAVGGGMGPGPGGGMGPGDGGGRNR